jgi:uncharacterized linocin/CFP29 family protein
MNNLRRELAPLSAAAWAEIDREARRVLKLQLAARKLVDFDGPLGTQATALNLGRQVALKSPADGVSAAQRQVLPLVELRVPFSLSRAEMDAVERGCKDPDLDALAEACARIAAGEDGAVFHGYAAAGIHGITEASPHRALQIGDRYQDYPALVSEATRLLRSAGVDGPYAIALGPRCYTGLMQATDSGYPVLQVVRRVIDGPIVWAPAVDGAVVLSMRGGDFELSVGQDLSIGYDSHDAQTVRLYLVETFAFRVLTTEAAVALRYSNGGKSGKRKR